MAEERIFEYVSAGPGRVDRAAGVLHNVKVLGFTSVNGRTYPKATILRAVPLYESAKVNVNHDERSAVRGYESRIGVLRGARAADDGLRANLHVNPKHPVAEQLFWDAENAPQNVGLSHTITGRTRRRNGTIIVEEILKVLSVDLVTDPATSAGLFESEGHAEDAEKQRMVDELAVEVGLPAIGVPPLDGGLRWCNSEAEIRTYLTEQRKFLQRKGLLPRTTPKPVAIDLGRNLDGTPQHFAARATGGLTLAESARFPTFNRAGCNGFASAWTL